jgi:hypothetical protein
MHGNDRLGPRCHRRNRRLWIDVERARLDIDEHRRPAKPADASGSREERIRARHHFVAGTDVERHQRREDGVGPRRHGDGVLDAEVGLELPLQPLHLRAMDEELAVADAGDGFEQGVAQRAVLGL